MKKNYNHLLGLLFVLFHLCFINSSTNAQDLSNLTVYIKVPTGNYLTAVNGGGMGSVNNTLPLHTNATGIGPWEKFKFIRLGDDFYAIQTINGNYLTAVNGGGMGSVNNTLPLHTDATGIGPWEKFTLIGLGDDYYALRTVAGNYLTAVNGGGMGSVNNTLPLHTDATGIGPWEKFWLGKPQDASTELEYEVQIDCDHGDIDNEETSNTITVELLNGNQVVTSRSKKGVNSCSWAGPDEKFILKATGRVTSLRIKTNGDNGFYIDELRIFQGGTLIAHHGRDDGKGWCLSTDPGDAKGSWKDYVSSSGCTASVTWDFK